MDGTTPPGALGGGYAFISYSHHDVKYVEKLERYLHDQGISFWRDHDVPPAGRWSPEIERRLRESSVVIVVETPSSKESTYVENEISIALSQSRPIFPLLLDGERFYQLGHLQHVDVRGGTLPPVGELGRLLGSPHGPAPAGPASSLTRRALVVTAIVVIVGLIGTLATVWPDRGDRSAEAGGPTATTAASPSGAEPTSASASPSGPAVGPAGHGSSSTRPSTSTTTVPPAQEPQGAETVVTLNVAENAYICMRQYVYGTAARVPSGSVVRLFVGDSPGPYFPAEEATYYSSTEWYAFVRFGQETTGQGTPYRLHAVVLSQAASNAIGSPVSSLPGTEYAAVGVLRKAHNAAEEPCAAP